LIECHSATAAREEPSVLVENYPFLEKCLELNGVVTGVWVILLLEDVEPLVKKVQGGLELFLGLNSAQAHPCEDPNFEPET
jgi:hypothetical protein